MTGILLGIARHARAKGPMEALAAAEITLPGGVAGDFRGGAKRKPHKRQVTLIERADWEAALAEIGAALPWTARRVNLLVDGIDLPQTPGARVRIGEVVLEITVECDPCSRMEALATGLEAALTPDWRAGACTKVIVGGHIAVGDEIRIENIWQSHSARSTTSAMSPESASSSARI